MRVKYFHSEYGDRHASVGFISVYVYQNWKHVYTYTTYVYRWAHSPYCLQNSTIFFSPTMPYNVKSDQFLYIAFDPFVPKNRNRSYKNLTYYKSRSILKITFAASCGLLTWEYNRLSDSLREIVTWFESHYRLSLIRSADISLTRSISSGSRRSITDVPALFWTTC